MASAGAGSAGVEVARGGVMNSPRYAGNGRRAGRLAALGAGYGSLPRGKEEKEEAGSAVVSSAGGGAGFRGRAVVYPLVRERNGVGTFSRVMGWWCSAAGWCGGGGSRGGVSAGFRGRA